MPDRMRRPYLLVLVGCDCGEFGLWEGEAVNPLGRQRVDLQQVHPRVMLDDVHTWLVFVHGLKDYLQREGEDVSNIATKSAPRDRRGCKLLTQRLIYNKPVNHLVYKMSRGQLHHHNCSQLLKSHCDLSKTERFPICKVFELFQLLND